MEAGRREDRAEGRRRGLHLHPPWANEKEREWPSKRMTRWQQGAWESRKDDQIRASDRQKGYRV